MRANAKHGTATKWKWDKCSCPICKAAKVEALKNTATPYVLPVLNQLRLANDETFSEVWRSKAECRRHGPMDWKVENGKTRYMTDEEWGAWTSRVFFVQRGGSSEEAKTICERCPVKAECLSAGLVDVPISNKTPTGIWGGLSQRERQTIRGRKWESR